MPEMYDARVVQCPIRAVPEWNDARDRRRPRRGKHADGGESYTETDTDEETEMEAITSRKRY
jgi:hypothetical protein